MSFDINNCPVAIDLDKAHVNGRFGMIGLSRGPRGMSPLRCGVEVHVRSLSSAAGSTQLEVVAGRRFTMPGFPQYEHSDDDVDDHGRNRLHA